MLPTIRSKLQTGDVGRWVLLLYVGCFYDVHMTGQLKRAQVEGSKLKLLEFEDLIRNVLNNFLKKRKQNIIERCGNSRLYGCSNKGWRTCCMEVQEMLGVTDM